MDVLANRLKWLREKNRLGQKEVASNIDVTLSGYQQFEYGKAKPKLETLVKIALYYKVTTDFLLGLSDTVDSLNELEIMFSEFRIKKEVLRRELESASNQLHEVYARKGISAQTIGFSIENEAKEHMLSSRKVKIEKELYVIQDKYREIIFNYIDVFLGIPESNVSKNQIIKTLSPFSIEIQPNIFDEFSLALFCNEGFIGNYGAYKTEEDALKIRHELLMRLNNRN